MFDNAELKFIFIRIVKLAGMRLLMGYHSLARVGKQQNVFAIYELSYLLNGSFVSTL